MRRLSPGRKLMAMVGFTVLALSPSFEDWEQSPELRRQFLVYYGVALPLIYFGALK